MTDRLYLRHSTDKQTDARQRHALAALLAAGAPAYEDPATSSRVLSLNRAGFKQWRSDKRRGVWLSYPAGRPGSMLGRVWVARR